MGKKMAAWRIEEEVLEWLQEEAKKRGKTQTALIEEGLELLLGELCPTCGQTVPPGNKKRGN